MMAIFTYGFPVADEAFRKAKVELTTLSNYEAVLDLALSTNYIHESELQALQDWRKSPGTWEPKTAL
jgi:orotate phosphoribosyltransferase